MRRVRILSVQSVPVLPITHSFILRPSISSSSLSSFSHSLALSHVVHSFSAIVKMSARKDAQVGSTTWLLNNIELKDISKCLLYKYIIYYNSIYLSLALSSAQLGQLCISDVWCRLCTFVSNRCYIRNTTKLLSILLCSKYIYNCIYKIYLSIYKTKNLS